LPDIPNPMRIILIIRYCTALLLTSCFLWGQFTYTELLYLPWGISPQAAGLRDLPEGRLGPAAFRVVTDSIFLLDAPNQRLKLFKSGNFLNQQVLPDQSSNDFLWDGTNRFTLLHNNLIQEFSGQDLLNAYRPVDPNFPLTGIFRNPDGKISVIINETKTSGLNSNGRSQFGTVDSYNQADLLAVQIIKENFRSFRVEFSEKEAFRIISDSLDFGSARHLGQTPSGHHYIYLEYITNHVPLRVDREVRLYSREGQLLAHILVPSHSHARVFREFDVDNLGNLYHLLTASDGIHIFGWMLNPAGLPVVQPYRYPARFRSFYHYNLLPALFDDRYGRNKSPPLLPKKPASVSRSEALAIGDTYVQHTWTATSSNITGGWITDPNGVAIETPSWVQVGVNQKVPYKWGGFNTISGFDSGIANGKYAGDRATTGVSSYCVGVDCSGFVSRCWKLASHYSTRMMDDYITIAYDNWSQIKPADAAHKVGHVRLAVNNNTNGTILTVEAAGADWRVSYRVFDYDDLTNYTPRYYRDIFDEPVTVQPELVTVSFTDSVNVTWTVTDTSNVQGIDLDFNLIGAWYDYQPDQLIAPDQTGISLNFSSVSPIFFKTRTISTDDIGSNFSDSYGCYDAGTVAKILIVDGFDRISGSYSKSSHEFAMMIGKSLSSSSLSFESVANEAVIAGSVDLMDYVAIIWLLGDESTSDQTFSSTEQSIVKNYLKLGGKLFVSGSEIGWDLDHEGSTNDRTFIKDYLKVLLDEDASGSYTVIGAANTVFDSLTLHYDDGSQGIYKEDYPDSFLPQPGAEILLSYGNGQTAACGFKGVFPNGIQTGAAVVMGFPVETIYDPDEQAILLNKILEYFEILPDTESPIPFEFVLHGNYPNPFNIRTNFAFTTSHEMKVKVKVFNLLGQQVATIAEQLYSADTHSIPYNANGLASGLYLYSLEAEAQRHSGKFVLIK